MNKEYFGKIWETEYIKARVEKISHSVENGDYEGALDMLRMIQDKAKMAEIEIREFISQK